jgi:RNA polymerase sigma-70 factor, ECF subfamily
MQDFTSPIDDQPIATDRSLLRRVEHGDSDAATQFYHRHAGGLLDIAKQRIANFLQSQVDPEDIVQSVFKSFFKRASNGEYYAPEGADLFNLLTVIAMRKINAKADYLQSQRRDVRKQCQIDDMDIIQASSQDNLALVELCSTIDELLSEVSEVQQEIIRRRLEGYSVEDISEQCGRSRRTVERELQAFRDRLCRYFTP